MEQWADESIKQFSDSMTQWTGDSVNRWINELTNQRASELGRGRACALGFSIACALDLLWAKTWCNTDHYRSIFCVAGAFSLHVRKEWEWKRALYLLCAICRNRHALHFVLAALLACGRREAFFFLHYTFAWQYECKSLWLNVIILCTCQWSSPFCVKVH